MGTLDSYYEANMDLININPQLNLYNYKWPILTNQGNLPPAKTVFDDEGRRGLDARESSRTFSSASLRAVMSMIATSTSSPSLCQLIRMVFVLPSLLTAVASTGDGDGFLGRLIPAFTPVLFLLCSFGWIGIHALAEGLDAGKLLLPITEQRFERLVNQKRTPRRRH